MKFYSFEDIRTAGNCAELARDIYGAEIRNNRCAATWRGGDNSEAVHIEKDKWFDHVTKDGGGIIELALFKTNGDKQAAQEFLGEYLNLTPKIETGAQPLSSQSRYDKLLGEGYTETARYIYRDATGKAIYLTARLEHSTRSKTFTQGHYDKSGAIRWTLKGVETSLYRLPEILAASWVAICEGEKSANHLAANGIPATTAPMGAGKWRDSYTEALTGKDVVIFPDNDEPGVEHAQLIARELHGKAKSIRVVGPLSDAPKGGVDDYLTSINNDTDQLYAAISDTPPYLPVTASTDEPTERMLNDAKQANTTPLRNFIPNKVEVEKGRKTVTEIEKEPRTHQALLDDLNRRFLSFPRKVGANNLFDHDRDSGEIIDIKDSDCLLAWIGRRSKMNPEWARGDAMVTQKQFFASIRDTVRRYESIAETPDWPRRDDVYYAHGELPAPCPNHSRFLGFIDYFNPASEVDLWLIAAFVCAPLWYIPGIPRPSWIIDSPDGQGAGKSNLVEIVADLYGHDPIRTSKQELNQNLQQLVKRCVSRSGRDARLLLIDNVTGDFQSPELADLITARSISGIAPYGRGEECRPNNLVYAITANSATVSTDLADRSIYIHVRKPEDWQRTGWKEEVQRYIQKHRLEIFADIIAMLKAHKPFKIECKTRFPEFEQSIMQPCCGSPDRMKQILEHLSNARADSNIDEDQARMIEETFRFNLEANLTTSNQPVFIRSEVVNSWGRQAIQDSYDYKGKPIQLIRNLAKAGFLSMISKDVTRWPKSSSKKRYPGIAWHFKPGTDQAVVIGRDGGGGIGPMGDE